MIEHQQKYFCLEFGQFQSLFIGDMQKCVANVRLMLLCDKLTVSRLIFGTLCYRELLALSFKGGASAK